MQLIKSIRNNSHDIGVKDDTDAIRPQEWLDHFSGLLSAQPEQTEAQKIRDSFVENNIHSCDPVFNQSFTKIDLKNAICRLKNNKSSSFDLICNEMLKIGIDTLSEPLLLLFNTIHESGIYPSQWKKDIMQPLHKSGDKSDPNNFRGITVSSNLGKLFNQLLLLRLHQFCSKNNLIEFNVSNNSKIKDSYENDLYNAIGGGGGVPSGTIQPNTKYLTTHFLDYFLQH